MDPKITDKALEIVDQLTAGLKAVAPQMADLTLAAIRFEGMVQLGICILITMLAISVVIVNIKLFNRLCNNHSIDRELCGFLLFALVVTMVPLPIMSVIYWCNTNMWAAVFDPRIAIALKVLNKVM